MFRSNFTTFPGPGIIEAG